MTVEMIELSFVNMFQRKQAQTMTLISYLGFDCFIRFQRKQAQTMTILCVGAKILSVKFQRKQAQTMTSHHEYAANATRDTHNEISVLLYSAPVQQSVCTRKGESAQNVDLSYAFSSAKHPRGSGPHSSELRATT